MDSEKYFKIQLKLHTIKLEALEHFLEAEELDCEEMHIAIANEKHWVDWYSSLLKA